MSRPELLPICVFWFLGGSRLEWSFSAFPSANPLISAQSSFSIWRFVVSKARDS